MTEGPVAQQHHHRLLLSLDTDNRAHALVASQSGRNEELLPAQHIVTKSHPPRLRGDKHRGVHVENPQLPAMHR